MKMKKGTVRLTLVGLAILLATAQFARSSTQNRRSPATDANKALIRRYFEA